MGAPLSTSLALLMEGASIYLEQCRYVNLYLHYLINYRLGRTSLAAPRQWCFHTHQTAGSVVGCMPRYCCSPHKPTGDGLRSSAACCTCRASGRWRRSLCGVSTEAGMKSSPCRRSALQLMRGVPCKGGVQGVESPCCRSAVQMPCTTLRLVSTLPAQASSILGYRCFWPTQRSRTTLYGAACICLPPELISSKSSNRPCLQAAHQVPEGNW